MKSSHVTTTAPVCHVCHLCQRYFAGGRIRSDQIKSDQIKSSLLNWLSILLLYVTRVSKSLPSAVKSDQTRSDQIKLSLIICPPHCTTTTTVVPVCRQGLLSVVRNAETEGGIFYSTANRLMRQLLDFAVMGLPSDEEAVFVTPSRVMMQARERLQVRLWYCTADCTYCWCSKYIHTSSIPYSRLYKY